MKKTFQEAIEHRRSIYALGDKIEISQEQIETVIETALINTPSAFNSQSTRIVLLTKENHTWLWDTTKSILKDIVPTEAFAATEKKINTSFASGYGTILFYEDMGVIEGLQSSFPLYADRFPVWAEHTSAMHQFVVWTMLEEMGLGASLQHYNPLIDSSISSHFGINSKWKLIAQMPFGTPLQFPGEKSLKPLEDRFIKL